MKQIAPNYTYNKTTGVITLTGVNIDRDQLLLIVNTTRNVTYYNFADSATTLQAFTQAANTSITLATSVVSASAAHNNADALTIYYDDQSSIVSVKTDLDVNSSQPCVALAYDSFAGVQRVGATNGFPIRPMQDGGGNSIPLPISGTVTSLAGGETPNLGTANLTNDTRWELNTEGFGHIAIEVVSSGVAWSSNGVVAQAYNETAPSTVDIFAPAGIRYRHSTDGATLNQALNNFYYNLNIAPNVGNAYGTSFIRIDGNTATTLGLPATGTRYFLFDLTTSRFALRPFFSAGTVTVKYRLYKGKHPFFSARNIIATGDGTGGAVRVTGAVYVDGGYLDNEVTAYVNGGTVNTYPQQGSTASNTNFTSTTSATLVSAVANREVLTVFNEGAGTLFINVGSSASTTSYQVRLSAGDYWEAPAGQQSMIHSGIFSSSGSTARVTEIS